MPSKPKSSKPGPARLPVAAAAGSDDELVPVEAQEVENFDELFGDGSENVTVGVSRIEPRYFDGQRVDGYLGKLEPGSDLETIAVKYGGGYYVIVKRLEGRFSRRRHVRIAGSPRVECPPPSDVSANPPAGGAVEVGDRAAPDVPMIDVGGVEVPLGDVNRIKEVALFVRMLKVAFPEPPSINDALLQIALNRQGNQGDVIAQADQFAALAEKLKSLTGGGGETGTGWLDIGSQALATVNNLIMKRDVRAPGIPVIDKNPPALPDKTRLAAGELPGRPQVTVGSGKGEVGVETAPDPGSATETEMSNYSQIAEKAASYIVQGFVIDPRQTPGQTAHVLEAVLPGLPGRVLDQLKSYRSVLSMVARNILNAQIETDPQTLTEFDLYFENVFNIFTGEPSPEVIQKPSNGEADNETKPKPPDLKG